MDRYVRWPENVCHQTKSCERAIAAYQRTLELSPRMPSVMTNLASCYEAMNRVDLAISLYQFALEIDSTVPMVLGNLSAIYQEQGKINKAFPLLEQAVVLNPGCHRSPLLSRADADEAETV